MLEPQIAGVMPCVAALDQVLHACDCESVEGGGWADWRHGYVGRVTQDIDMYCQTGRVDDFLQAASVSGFEVPVRSGGTLAETMSSGYGIDVDILPKVVGRALHHVQLRRQFPIPNRWAAFRKVEL